MEEKKIDEKFADLFKIISMVNDRVSLNADTIEWLIKLVDKTEKMPDFSDRRKPGETLH